MYNPRHEPPQALSTDIYKCLVIGFIVIIGCNYVSADLSSEFVKGKICIGTNGRMSVPSSQQHHYRNLRDRYTNCTYVDGNLEITWLQNQTFDLSFLQYIREVTGYVLISHVDVKVVLPRLQIIRGRTLFKLSIHDVEFALLVTMCNAHNLEMPALRDILNGSVGMYNNFNLCHIKTINWDEIITGVGGKYVYVFNFTTPERVCPECDETCEQGCWGEGPENCQKFSKTNCSPQCWQGRCFGPNPRECCHLFCAGGCTGPKQSDCLACKNFFDDGVCTQECPPMQKYNPTEYEWEPNPDGKYAYGATCVRKCPVHLLKDNGACVRSCPPKKKALNGECVPCDGPCPKTCQGVDKVHSGNIDSFKDCTIIEGSITILDQTFKGYVHFYSNYTSGSKYEPMHPDRLEVFSTLKEITGFLNIQGDHADFKNLSYFRNLETIGGRALTEYFASLYIIKTSLTSLGLQSLKKINSGAIAILENRNLCYAKSIDWSKIRKSQEHTQLLSANKNESLCIKEGLICDKQCSHEGCWGAGSTQCLSCKNFILGNICLENCNALPGIYQEDEKTCKPCHEECAGTCVGPRAEHCTSCKHFRDGPYCVPKCKQNKYEENGECKTCHTNCVDGCTGPENKIGPGGCNSCEKAIIDDDLPGECLQKRDPCPDGYYYEWIDPQEQGPLKALAGTGACKRCHHRCKKCTGYGVHEQACQECVRFKRGEHCEDECPLDHYVQADSQLCIPCDTECRSCYGPGSNQCYECRNLRLYAHGQPVDNTTAFNCTGSCPAEYPHKIYPPEGDPHCSAAPIPGFPLENEIQPAILMGVGSILAVILGVSAIIMWQWRLKTKAKENTVKMTMALTGLDDNEPLRPTGVKPNLAKLRIIKEEEMRKGGILGYGAFGNVYKGVWVPEGENVKIPVAIKVLHDSTGANTSKEFLDEAYIMASVEHPNLLQLLAVCMTSQMMLVTQLMPLGCLLDFVRTYKDKIGSKPMLNWCTQIARGMSYLEERRLVHRDLAARNVLVQTPSCVKITDFGLAKLLDINEDQYKAAGGKMPIKWLALECIQHRVFTHKSDVWAFGVTIWEILTYGGRPYEQIPARNVPEFLEKGDRLPQPEICSIDVYMIMVSCWFLDAESRPTFKELSDNFAKMSRDPGRYLAITGDMYMRLPSYTPQDEKEMIRNLASAMDGPEALLDIDEYLQPKSRAPLPAGLSASSLSGSPPSTPLKTCWPNGNPSLPTDSPTPQNQQNWDRELLRYNAAHGTTSQPSEPPTISAQFPHYSRPTSHCRQVCNIDSSNRRYCSDPLKTIGARDCDVTDDCFNSKIAPVQQQAQIGNLKLDLPLDEDDYLMPSPQLPANVSQYMDLISDAKSSESEPKKLPNGYRKYPEFLTIPVCIGTNGRLSAPSNRQHHYRNLRDRYTNCTYVDGNLEITWLQNQTFDLSFLQYIREVTGYVLISHVDVKVVLPRLQIIRGRTLFKLNIHDVEFALLVTSSNMYNLEMPALRDILNGSVGMYNNFNLCHIKTINWDEIITGPGGKYVYVYNFTNPERVCPECDETCEQGCWGEGPENCQKFSKTNCSPQCWQGRCFGPNPRECCHLFCAGGCTGPKQSDCLACKNFFDDGVCTQECPPMQKYNPTSYEWETNPNGKYAYGATCVRKCPEHLLKDSGACVRSCPPKKKALNGECVPCDGPCPKTCQGVDKVHSGNIDTFKDCTIIEGSITILDQSFAGFQSILPDFTFGTRYGPMHPDNLEVFSTLKEITGYLNIQGAHQDFKNLSYFRNLEIIDGRTLTEHFAALYIVKTSLVSLGLSSLKRISSGCFAILENKELCYAQSINWTRIRKSPEYGNLLFNNRNESECIKAGLICHEQCSDEGCWGPGPSQCLSCKNFELGNVCLESCNALPGIYEAGPKICKQCHEECAGTCSGPTAEHCTECKHFRDGKYCVPHCQSSKYEEDGECKTCHTNCVDGCTGPENKIGPGGCNSCEKAIIDDDLPGECLQKRDPCPDGYYYEWIDPQEQGPLKALAGTGACKRCHPRCKKCTGYGVHEQACQECIAFKRGEHCEEECPLDHYVQADSRICIPCDSECRSCWGSEPNECYQCRNLRFYGEGDPADNSTSFNCTALCPHEYPHKIFPPEGEPYCSIVSAGSAFQQEDIPPAILMGVGSILAVILLVSAIIIWQWRLRTKAKENTMKMTMALTGVDDNEPLHPTGVKPNLAKLRIIKEEDMRKGGILGYGAFGNVYKGVWVPEGENVKIPVAIKVLHDSTGANTSKEFLDEAYIMASVEHPNLLQLLAVCMTSQMMLVTQLMPLGCLLDFVRTYKDKIGSKPMLNWCTQIARGMSYLEERRLVHRDLAARNVLVQTPSCVKITDFGLAKLLDINEDQYKAAGGKMPIKWLALECIQHRVFTHKSDVWAFGVTIWEILTYGGRPYEQIPARNVPEFLEKGDRLPQPKICSIDVYMIMISCWFLDAESRPGFKELSDNFAKMSRDPGRYLAIKGDKYMRLPAYTIQDEKEMIRNLATVDSRGAVLEGDEYLQPKSRAPLPPGVSASNTSGSINGIPSLATDSPTPQNQQNFDREMLRYNAAHGASGTSNEPSISGHTSNYTHFNGHCGQGTSVSSSSRYCSDSIPNIGVDDCDTTDDCFTVEVDPAYSQAQVGNLKLDLPLDEDDYLMPSPKVLVNASQYMDLIGDIKPTDSEPKRLHNGYRNVPEFLTIIGKTSLDNPEYMSQDDDPVSPQSIGLSTPDLDKVLKNDEQVRQKNSEEESDHEYYNDFDRLERELQPLKKNETTV